MTDAANMLKSTILLITKMIQILEKNDDPEAPQAFFEAYNEASGQLNASVYQALHPLLRAQSRQGRISHLNDIFINISGRPPPPLATPAAKRKGRGFH